ncbi:hypothetical protein [Fodinibius roseus]|uniref:hypothetical protein n=1 Tax=Fodinibius roseus TaxID=1194090 RepID=UPI001481C687|nr:hypothetical protein [Fodinibius roseus]
MSYFMNCIYRAIRIHRARKKLRGLFTTCCHIRFDANGEFAGCTIKDHCGPL